MLQLTRKVTDTIPIDGSLICPNRLAGRSVDEISQMTTTHGNRPEQLGDLFTFRGSIDDNCIEVDGDCRNVKWLGAGMTHGSLIIRGNAGNHAGAEMRGGRIEIHGDAGDYCGTAMRGGELRIHASAGDDLGGAKPGQRKGMRGGIIIVDGNARNGCGTLMRRGMIAIGENCGERAGAGMIAGTIVVAGDLGPEVGSGMKRGTIVCGGTALHTSLGFAGEGNKSDPLGSPFLELLWRSLGEHDFIASRDMRTSTYRLYRGDRLNAGLGELLVANR